MKQLLLVICAALLISGCGDKQPSPVDNSGKKNRLVDFDGPVPYVNALEVDPESGDFLLTTNKGFWRIGKEDGKVTQVKGKISAEGKSDTVGTFLEIEAVGGQRLIGSGHPDTKGALPEFLGFIESEDLGKTWRVISRLGEADLHKVLIRHGKMYAFDAVLGAMLISKDNGKTFEERFTPRGLIIDFEIDPKDENHILAATEDQLYRSEDGGNSWKPAGNAAFTRLLWTEQGLLLRALQDGTVEQSEDGGESWKPLGKVDGEPYKFKTLDGKTIYLALSDGSILSSTDAGKTFEKVFTP